MTKKSTKVEKMHGLSPSALSQLLMELEDGPDMESILVSSLGSSVRTFNNNLMNMETLSLSRTSLLKP